MKSSRPSEKPEPLTGEVLPPKPEPATYEELADFLTAHGVKPPRPKSYRSLKAALSAIVTHEAGLDGTGHSTASNRPPAFSHTIEAKGGVRCSRPCDCWVLGR